MGLDATMRILLTNDDGIFAPGLAALYKRLVDLGEVTVVAPTEGWSGASHSITFHEPLACTKVQIGDLFTGFGVQGSPADCVKLASMQLHDGPIDLVVSGINYGANVGINVYYSGTVAAAMEAAFLGIPSAAISVAAEDADRLRRGRRTRRRRAQEASAAARRRRHEHQRPAAVPRPAEGRPRRPAGHLRLPRVLYPARDTASELVFQLAGGTHREEKAPADTTALADGYITVTALRPDMTDHEKTVALRAISTANWEND